MRPWSFSLEVDADERRPLFVRIAAAVVADIGRGRLAPGAVLPGSRTLAASLGVHRNTVLAAYRDLMAQGWVASELRCLRVVDPLPLPLQSRASAGKSHRATRRSLPFALPPRPSPRDYPPAPSGVLSFGGGLPDLEAFPRAALATALRRAVNGKGEGLLGYGDPRGDQRLREVLRSLLAEVRGLAFTPDELLITSGTQGGLDWVARILLRPGDHVGVEDPGYRRAWETLRMAGATLEPLPVDAEGLDVARLATRLARGARPLRALYLTPHHQFPTTVTLTPARRQQLLTLAGQHQFAIIEDDYDFEFHYEGRPVQPLASRDRDGSVIYLGTLSKLLAPGLRLGFLVAPAPFTQAITDQRAFAERHGCAFVERAVAELIEDGLLQRQARKLRRLYLSRREVLMESLRRHFKDDVIFTPPAGGMSLWAQFPGQKDMRGWAQRGQALGVSFYPGELFDFAGRNLPTSRLGFSPLTEKQLAEAVRRMAAARGA